MLCMRASQQQEETDFTSNLKRSEVELLGVEVSAELERLRRHIHHQRLRPAHRSQRARPSGEYLKGLAHIASAASDEHADVVGGVGVCQRCMRLTAGAEELDVERARRYRVGLHHVVHLALVNLTLL